VTSTRLGFGVLQQAVRVMVGERDAVQILRKLVGVGVAAEMTLVDTLPERCGDYAEPVTLQLPEPVANWAGPVIQLRCRRHEQTSARHRREVTPFDPVLEEGSHTRKPAWLGESGAHDTLDKAVGRVLQDPDLQGLFRLEVGEKAALGELELVGEGADGEAFEPYTARQPDGVVEDRIAGHRSLAHETIKARPFVSVKAQICSR